MIGKKMSFLLRKSAVNRNLIRMKTHFEKNRAFRRRYAKKNSRKNVSGTYLGTAAVST